MRRLLITCTEVKYELNPMYISCTRRLLAISLYRDNSLANNVANHRLSLTLDISKVQYTSAQLENLTRKKHGLLLLFLWFIYWTL